MAAMKMDVNFVFFVLIIATVVAFAGFTAYYQVSFRNINEEYSTKLAELNKVTTDLLDKKAVLSQTSEELNKTIQGREELGEKYDSLKGERDTLMGERDDFRDKYFKANSELATTKTKLTQANTEIAEKEAEISLWKSRHSSCEDDYDDCKSDLASCQAS